MVWRIVDRLLAMWLRVPRAVRWVVPVALMALLWWSSEQPPSRREPSMVRALLHNGMHVVAYGALAAATWLAWASPRRERIATVGAVLVAVLYGIVDELHQSHVPGRVSSIADAVSDACGALLAVALLRARLCSPTPSPLLLAAFAVACIASVAVATWGPW